MGRLDSRWFVLALLGLGMVCGPRAVAGAPTPSMAPAINSCGNASTDPRVFGVDMVSPRTLTEGGFEPANWDPRRARLDRNGIHYVAAGGVRLNVVTDRCTFISSVRVGSRVLTETYDQGYWFSAQPASPQPSDPIRYAHSLWVFYP